MNDPKVDEALRRLAERGTPRGADRVFEDATRDGAVVRPLDRQAAPGSGGRAPSRVRYAIAASVIAVVAAGGVAYTLRDDGDTTPVSAGSSNFCDVMSASALDHSTVAWVYLDPEADAAVVAEVGEVLDARPEVQSIRYFDTDETYQRFTDLFEDDEAMLENVRAEDLPTSYEVQLVDRRADTKTAFRDAVAPAAGVYDVQTGIGGLRVIDLIRLGLGESPVRSELVNGVVLHLDDLDDGSAPDEIIQDLDLAAEALIDGFEELDRDRRVEVLRARDRIVSYASETCDLTDPYPPTPDGSAVATTVAEADEGD